tara:strand:+ start:439 stop:594 length:156 start_codon:yes stop_codon:yes gene_type:complete
LLEQDGVSAAGGIVVENMREAGNLSDLVGIDDQPTEAARWKQDKYDRNSRD